MKEIVTNGIVNGSYFYDQEFVAGYSGVARIWCEGGTKETKRKWLTNIILLCDCTVQ